MTALLPCGAVFFAVDEHCSPFGNGRRLSLPPSDLIRQHPPDANAPAVPEPRPGHFLLRAVLCSAPVATPFRGANVVAGTRLQSTGRRSGVTALANGMTIFQEL